MWILDYWEDLESDFSAIHRYDGDLLDMPASRLCHLAERLFAYQGVLRARLEEQISNEKQQPVAAPVGPAPQPVRTVDLTPQALALDPNLQGLISYAKAPSGGG